MRSVTPSGPLPMSGVTIQRVTERGTEESSDNLAVEEPLEIQIEFGDADSRNRKSVAVTMRTPGADPDLAAGFLFTEGIVKSSEEIVGIEHCGPPSGKRHLQNVIRVRLDPSVTVDVKRLERHFFMSSSCGVCGKSSIDAVRVATSGKLADSVSRVPASVIHGLAETLQKSQDVFARTGGLHAAGLFDFDGSLIALREDVGRHNAVDKLIGSSFMAGQVPLNERVIMVSGRASFELVQKSVVAGIPVMAAVGAPSSLAVELAKSFNLTLLGFVRDERFNVYSGGGRVGVGELGS